MAETGVLGVAASGQVSLTAPGRETNQDAIGRWAPDLPTERARVGVLFLVADGVGAERSGPIASQTVVETALQVYRREYDGSPLRSLERALRAANGAVLDKAADQKDLQGMASTCTAAVVHGSHLYVAHVGDSRAYLVRHGKTRRLTRDHTWTEDQTSATTGTALPHSQALSSAPTRLLGSAADVAVDLLQESLHDGDVVILCSDGMSATVDEPSIARLISTGEDAHGAAEILAQEARKRGSTDDISVSVLVIEPVAQPATGERSAAVEPERSVIRAPALDSPMRALGLLVLGVAVASVMLLAGVFGLYQLTFRDRMFPGVRALGVDLGGRSVDEAARVLDTRFLDYARQPLTLEAAGQQFFLSAGELGVRLDATATARGAMNIGRSGNILRQVYEQVRGLTSGRDAPLVYQVDEARMQAALNPLAQRVEATTGKATDAALLIDPDAAVRVQPGKVGRTLDRAASEDVISERLQVLGAGTLRLPAAEVPPAVTEASLAPVRAQAERILAQPLTVQASDRSVQMTRQQLASLLAVHKEVVNGQPEVTLNVLNGEAARLLEPLAQQVARAPVNARLNWDGTNLNAFQPGQDGLSLDVTQAARSLEQQLLSQNGPVVLEPTAIHALDQNDAATLRIRETVMEASVPIDPAIPWHTTNVQLTAQRLHGWVIMPGQSFSVLSTLGTISPDQGFVLSPGASVPIDLTDSGVTLVSSALAQSVFWSGYVIEDRYPHSRWLTRLGIAPRGQPGLDANLDVAQQQDFRFTNSSDSPALVQTRVANGQLTVSLVGTKPSWNVSVEEPVITNQVPPDGDPERRDDPSVATGQEVTLEERSDGFSATIRRSVQIAGESGPRVLNLSANYRPNAGVTLVGPKPPEPAP